MALTSNDLQIITLAEAKANSRIDGNLEDAAMLRACKSAEEGVLNVLNRSLEDIIEEYGDVPSPIVSACLCLADHYFTHRSPTSAIALHDIPYTIDFMLKSYIRF